MDRVWLGLGAFYGLTGVMMAALAAHALPGRLSPADLGFVHAAIEMKMWHALALIGCGVLARLRPGRAVTLAGAAFGLGVLCFCGAVYSLALGGLDLPAVAPLGGFLTMAGWVSLGTLAFRR